MNTTHDWERLSLYGFKGLERIARQRRYQRNMERLGGWLIVFFLVLCLIASWPAHAEPQNAKDVKGNFVLVVGGTGTASGNINPWTYSPMEDIRYRIQPFVVTGFTSFQMCTGAGKELQARLNSDGYTLDFSCIATGR